MPDGHHIPNSVPRATEEGVPPGGPTDEQITLGHTSPNSAWKRPDNPYPLVTAIAEKMDGLDSLQGRRHIAWEILDLLENFDG